MTTVNAYLNFNGNCEEAFKLYKSVFGGEFSYMGRFKEMPPMDGKTFPAEEGERVMHVSLPISKETILMGSDTSEAMGPPVIMGTNISVSVNTDSEKEATRIFNELSMGGKIHMPLDKTFWGALFGMFTDRFGINWMVSYDYNQAGEKQGDTSKQELVTH